MIYYFILEKRGGCDINTNKEILRQSIYDCKIKFTLNGEELSTEEIIDFLNVLENESSKKYLILDASRKSKYFILIYILFNYINSFTSDYDLILRNLSKGELIFRGKSFWEFISYENNLLEIKSLTNTKKDKGLVSKIPSHFFYEIILLDKKKSAQSGLDFNKSKPLDSQALMIDNRELFNSLKLKKDCILNNLDNEIIIVTSMSKEEVFGLFENISIIVDNVELKVSEIIPIDFTSIYGNEENIIKSSIHKNNLIRVTNSIYQARNILRTNRKKTKFLFTDRESYFISSDNIIDYQLSDIFYDENLSNLIILNSRNDIYGIDKLFNDFDIDSKHVLLNLSSSKKSKVETIKVSDKVLNLYIETILRSIKNIVVYKNSLDLIENFIIYTKKLLNYFCYYYCLPLSILKSDLKMKNFIDDLLDMLFDIYEESNLYPDIKNDADIILYNLLEIQYYLEYSNPKYQELLNCNLDSDTLIICKDKYIKDALLNQDEILKSNSDVTFYSDLIKNNDIYCEKYKQVIYLNISNINKFEFIGNNIAPMKKFILLSNEEINLYNRIVNEYKKSIKHLQEYSKFFVKGIKYESFIDSDLSDNVLPESIIENGNIGLDRDIDINLDYDMLEDDLETVFVSPNFAYKKNSNINTKHMDCSENGNVKVCKKLLFKENKYMLIGNNTSLPVLFDNDKYKRVHHKYINQGDTIISIETSASNKLISDLFVKYVRHNDEYSYYISVLDTAKKALVDYMNTYDFDYDTVSKELEHYGIKREAETIKSWINSYKTIGSRQQDFYLAIYKITNNPELKVVLDDCYKSEDILRTLKTHFRLKIIYHLILNLKFNEDINLEYINYLTSSDIEKLKNNMDKYIYVETILDINPMDTDVSASDIGRILTN